MHPLLLRALVRLDLSCSWHTPEQLLEPTARLDRLVSMGLAFKRSGDGNGIKASYSPTPKGTAVVAALPSGVRLPPGP